MAADTPKRGSQVEGEEVIPQTPSAPKKPDADMGVQDCEPEGQRGKEEVEDVDISLNSFATAPSHASKDEPSTTSTTSSTTLDHAPIELAKAVHKLSKDVRKWAMFDPEGEADRAKQLSNVRHQDWAWMIPDRTGVMRFHISTFYGFVRDYLEHLQEENAGSEERYTVPEWVDKMAKIPGTIEFLVRLRGPMLTNKTPVKSVQFRGYDYLGALLPQRAAKTYHDHQADYLSGLGGVGLWNWIIRSEWLFMKPADEEYSTPTFYMSKEINDYFVDELPAAALTKKSSTEGYDCDAVFHLCHLWGTLLHYMKLTGFGDPLGFHEVPERGIYARIAVKLKGEKGIEDAKLTKFNFTEKTDRLPCRFAQFEKAVSDAVLTDYMDLMMYMGAFDKEMGYDLGEMLQIPFM